jgi:5-bromo-4-chloroindolyl phosphate hydrolysis protein
MMAQLNKHLGWIQLIIMLAGLVFIYGQQTQAEKDMERRTTQCEIGIREQNVSNRELLNAIGALQIDIAKLQTELKYAKGRIR